MKPLLLVFIIISLSISQISTTRRNLSENLQNNLKRISEICNQLRKEVKDGKIDYISQIEEFIDFFSLDPKKVEHLLNPYFRANKLKDEIHRNLSMDSEYKSEILKELNFNENKVKTYFKETDLAFGTYALCNKMLFREVKNTELINSIDLTDPLSSLKAIINLKIERSTGRRR